MLLLFDKAGIDSLSDKDRKVITEVNNCYKGSFITEGYFFFFR